ncbi:MAG: hypothetical protein ABR613_11785 [Actinomycetota bacterium]
MNLRRIAGAAGLISAGLFLLTIVLTFSAGRPPALDESAREVSSYYRDNSSMLQLNGVIGFITLFVIPLWFIPLYRWIRDRAWAGGSTGTSDARSDDDSGTWATIALAGFIATGAVSAVQTGVATALAQGIEDELGGNDATVTALFDLYNGLGAAVGALFALFALGLAYAARGTGYLPSWASPVLCWSRSWAWLARLRRSRSPTSSASSASSASSSL